MRAKKSKNKFVFLLPSMRREHLLLEVFQDIFSATQSPWLCFFTEAPADQDVAWLRDKGIQWKIALGWIARKKAPVVSTRFEKLLALCATIVKITWLGLWSNSFVVFEGGVPFSFGVSFLAKFGFLDVTYIAHGTHPKSIRISYPKVVAFSPAVSDLWDHNKSPQLSIRPFIRSLALAKVASRSRHSVESAAQSLEAPVLLFFGGWEDHVDHPSYARFLSSEQAVKMSKDLQDLGKLLKDRYPDIRLIYRPHPYNKDSYHRFVKPYVDWEVSQQSLVEDVLRAKWAVTYLSSAVFETAALGMPSAVIQSPISAFVSEHCPIGMDVSFHDGLDTISEWIGQNAQESSWKNVGKLEDFYKSEVTAYANILNSRRPFFQLIFGRRDIIACNIKAE